MLASCQESKEEAMLRLVNEWNGKEIKFPSRSTFTVLGKDTVDFTFDEADYKVLTYIDSVGYEWDSLLQPPYCYGLTKRFGKSCPWGNGSIGSTHPFHQSTQDKKSHRDE